MTFFKKISNCLKRLKNVVWQSYNGRVTSDLCRVTVQWLFQDFSELLETSKKRCLTVIQRSREPPTTVAWPSVTFFKIFPNCLKRLKNVVWQSYNGRVTSDHCRVTFSDFFQNFSELFETSKKRCLTVITTVAWPPTTVAWPSVTFSKISELLETSKNVLWQSSNGCVTSDHCRVTFSDFFKKFPNCLKRPKTLFDSHTTVAWPPTTVAWPSVTFFKIFPNCLKTSKKRCLRVIQRSRELRPLSRDRSVTFFKKISNCLKRPKTLFDSRPTVAWPPTTVAWPFGDFFQNCF